MRRLRSNLTYSNVVSTLCLFLLLGGGAAYAASHLGKNSVGTKQLKKNAVITAKIKNEAVTAAKVKKGTLTGTQINASTLGTVPAAQTADSIAAPEHWHEVGAPGEPAFLFGWGNAPGEPNQPETVGFYKDQVGVVHLKGRAVKSGATGSSTVFRLPLGYRPATDRVLHFAVPCSCSGPSVDEATVFGPQTAAPLISGFVDAPVLAEAVYLDGITFRAES